MEDYTNEKQCIHTYLTPSQINNNKIPPRGLADFLRGTVALYNYSKIYNYKLYLNNTHPIFTYLKSNKNIIYSNLNTTQLTDPMSWALIDSNLTSKFESGNSFSVMTNSFYKNERNELTNFGKISIDCKNFLKDILSPSIEIQNNINKVFNEHYKLDLNSSYKVIHLRIGDAYINSNQNNNELYNHYYRNIYNLINMNKNFKYILLTDSNAIGYKLKESIPELYYWNNSKIHLGTLNSLSGQGIIDTLTDFFIMSKSQEIIANSPLGPNVSGFSIVISEIYDIKYSFFASLNDKIRVPRPPRTSQAPSRIGMPPRELPKTITQQNSRIGVPQRDTKTVTTQKSRVGMPPREPPKTVTQQNSRTSMPRR